MKQGTSIELVDELGRKVRVTVTGHWASLNDQVVARILAAAKGGDEGQELGLSDIEEVR